MADTTPPKEAYLSARKRIQQLRSGDISSVELVEQSIQRIKALDADINAVVVRDFERARASAKAADKAISQKKYLPLLGLPITVKESFDIKGLSSTWGNPHYQHFKPKADAAAVSRLKAAGAIVLGKTNVPLMLRDWQTYNELYGTTNNPWDLKRTPGGSSGGAAAALAAGYVSLELGSDLAGSLRVPAHYCGVYTHKPTQDLIPIRGSTPPETIPIPTGVDLVTAGPLAPNTSDLLLAFDILKGPDEMLQGKGYRLDLPKPRHQKLSDFRVLLIDTHPLFPTDDATQKAFEDLYQHLTQAGVQVSRDASKAPSLIDATETYASLLSAFIGVNLPDEQYEHLKAIAGQLDTKAKSLEHIRLKGYSSSFRDYFLQTRRREALRLAWLALFKQFDVLLCPVMPTPAFLHNHDPLETRTIQVNQKTMSYFDQFIWSSIATVFGLPSTVAPIGTSQDGLPIGAQMIGSYLEDYTTLHFTALLEKTFGGFKAPSLE